MFLRLPDHLLAGDQKPAGQMGLCFQLNKDILPIKPHHQITKGRSLF
jgi:hypothetical protein